MIGSQRHDRPRFAEWKHDAEKFSIVVFCSNGGEPLDFTPNQEVMCERTQKALESAQQWLWERGLLLSRRSCMKIDAAVHEGFHVQYDFDGKGRFIEAWCSTADNDRQGDRLGPSYLEGRGFVPRGNSGAYVLPQHKPGR